MSTRLAFLAALALLGVTSATFARASLAAVSELGGGPFVPSELPTLLGPINEFGRNGWQCAPERAAQANKASSAALPAAAVPASERR